MSKKNDKPAPAHIAQNRKAWHDYFIEQKHEAGMVLHGWEVKSMRAGRAQLKEAYVVIENGELFLIGSHISPLPSALPCHSFSEWRKGSPNEPRFHSALTSRGDHCVNRTRVRKPYTYGSTCVVCLLCDAPPSGRQGDDALSLLEFNVSPTGTD